MNLQRIISTFLTYPNKKSDITTPSNMPIKNQSILLVSIPQSQTESKEMVMTSHRPKVWLVMGSTISLEPRLPVYWSVAFAHIQPPRWEYVWCCGEGWYHKCICRHICDSLERLHMSSLLCKTEFMTILETRQCWQRRFTSFPAKFKEALLVQLYNYYLLVWKRVIENAIERPLKNITLKNVHTYTV